MSASARATTAAAAASWRPVPDPIETCAASTPPPLAKAMPSGPLAEEDDDYVSDAETPTPMDVDDVHAAQQALGNLALAPAPSPIVRKMAPLDPIPESSPEIQPPSHRRSGSRNKNMYAKLPKCNDADVEVLDDEEFFYQNSDDICDETAFLKGPTPKSGLNSSPSTKSKSSRALVTSRLMKGFKAVKRASAKSTASAGKSLSAAWKSNPPRSVNQQNSADREEWLNSVLPSWKKRRRAARTRVLMFRGIPSSVRGIVWQTALGNPLNVSEDLYEVLKERALAGRAEFTRFQSICAAGGDITDSIFTADHQRSAHKSILLDLPRTFPGLAFFHADGSTYEDALRDILESFVYLRPDVGYSQGMSFLAAVLLLFMEPPEAFTCFVNMLLYKSCFLQFFRIQMPDVRIYLDVHTRLLAEEMPELHKHFQHHSIEPDIYMINWVMSLYCRALPLDLVSRIWDIYVFDGDVAIFRAALGILKLLQSRLLVMNFEEIAYCLSHLPTDDMNDDELMQTIRSVRVVTKKRFKELYRECQTKYEEENKQDQATASATQ